MSGEKEGNGLKQQSMTVHKEDELLTDFIEALDQKNPSGGPSIFDQSLRVPASAQEGRQSEDEGKINGQSDALSGMVVRKENSKSTDLCLRFSEETQCENAMFKASKKLATGSIFTVRIDLNESRGLLGIGVKELQLKMLTVIMLKRRSVASEGGEVVDDVLGPAEAAGVKLGDVIFGVNFAPVRDGSKTLLSDLEDKKKGPGPDGGFIHLQCWRCHNLCTAPAPGLHFPRMDDIVPKAFQLYRDGIFSDWERWNFIDILLNNMLLDLKHRQEVRSRNGPVLTSYELGMVKKVGGQLSSIHGEARKQLQVVDLERNILHAKCLRAALCVRIVHTKLPQKSDSVVYVLRVEDVETGLQWVVHRRYRDFHALHEELEGMSKLTRGLSFPQKKISLIFNAKLVEARMLTLEQYTRRVLYILNANALHDPMASRALRHVQRFLGVDKYIDCIYPPPVDDQRHMELLAFRFLNDFNSPACQQCMRFVSNVNLDSLQDPSKPEGDGYRPALRHLGEAMSEVEAFTLNRHQEQMKDELRARRPEMSAEAISVFVRRCVRRQVESALFLPLRRAVYRLVTKYVARSAQLMQTSLNTLSIATPAFFMVDANALEGTSLSRAVGKFRDIVYAYLPADQGQLLMHAAAAVVELHGECSALKSKRALRAALSSQDTLQKSSSCDTGAETQGGKGLGLGLGSAEKAASDHDPSREPRSNRNSNSGSGSGQGVPVPSQNPEEEVPASESPASASDDDDDEGEGDDDDEGADQSSTSSTGKYSIASGHNSVYSAPAHQSSRGRVDSESSRELGVSAARKRRSSTGAKDIHLDGAAGLAGAGGQREGGTGPWPGYCSPSRATFSFGRQEVLSDPVKAIFTSLETLPAAKLYRDDDNIINPSDLSFLDEEIPGTPTHVSPSGSAADLDQSMMAESPATPSREADSPPPPGTAAAAWSAKKGGFTTAAAVMARMETFSPSIDPPRYHSGGGSASREQSSPPRRGSTGSSVVRRAGNDDSESASAERRVKSMRNVDRSGLEEEDEGEGEGEGASVTRPFERLEIEEGSSHGNDASADRDRRGKQPSFTAVTPATDRSRLPSFAPLGSIKISEPPSELPSSPSMAGSLDSDRDLSLFDATADRLSEGVSSVGQNRGRSGRKESTTSDPADEARNTSNFYAGQMLTDAVSADDFLPMFTFTLAKAMLPQLVIVKEIMTTLVADEETYGECGYYLATLEAALKHISDLSQDFIVESER
jgi:hypothetical protein